MPEQSGSESTSKNSQITSLKLPSTCDPVSDSNPPKELVWIIFGATGELGRSLTKSAIEHGDKVTSVGWSQGDNLQELQSQQTTKSLNLLCDIRIRSSLDAIIKTSLEHWGRIDIIANCVSLGIIAPSESQSEHDLRFQLETNFFGTFNVLSRTLPIFRNQKHGRYLIYSCTAGSLGVPGLGPYCASKYAVEGLLESMLYEVDTYNIKATLIETGFPNFTSTDAKPETNGTKKGSAFVVKPDITGAYNDAHSPAMHANRLSRWLVDRQPVSTARCAELSWQLAHCRYPPLRLLLGGYAVESMRDRLRCIIEEIEDWKHLNFPVDEDDGGRSGLEGDGMQID